MAALRHNPDDEMTLADDELQLVAEELQLEDLPDGSLPADPPTDGAPASKKLCTEGDVSDVVPGPSSSALPIPNTSTPLPNANALPTAPLATAQAVSPHSKAPLIPPAYAASSAAPVASPSAADPPRQLAPAAAGGAGAEAIRADLITRISKHLQPFHFRNNVIPKFQPSVGGVLRIPRRAYTRLCFSWPSQDDADDFKGIFPHTFHLPNSRSVLLKVYVDRYPRFTSASAEGAATLMHQDDVPGFLCIPPVINFEDDSPPALLNISSHMCSFCCNNHRDADHEIFPTKRRQRLSNKQQLSVAQLQQANSKPVPSAPLLSAPPPGGILNPLLLLPPSCLSPPCPPYPELCSSPPSCQLSGSRTVLVALLLPATRLYSPYLPHPERPTSLSGLLLCSRVAFASLTPHPPHLYPPCPPCPMLSLIPLPGMSPGSLVVLVTPSLPLTHLLLHCPPYPDPCPLCSMAVNAAPLSPPTHLYPPCPLYPGLCPTSLSGQPLGSWAVHHVLRSSSPPTLGSKNPPCICIVRLPPTSALSLQPPFPHLLANLCPRAGQVLGSRAAPAAFRNDPGLLSIGLDADFEPWTCALCKLTCGTALDSAMAHIASGQHASKKLAAAHVPDAKEKYTGWKAMAFVALPHIANFLAML
ncbi:unnamed protein product [Closterium sp. Naga37s-1]|nr:unnamed protein product [Closterium sp. Naga37s-1]